MLDDAMRKQLEEYDFETPADLPVPILEVFEDFLSQSEDMGIEPRDLFYILSEAKKRRVVWWRNWLSDTVDAQKVMAEPDASFILCLYETTQGVAGAEEISRIVNAFSKDPDTKFLINLCDAKGKQEKENLLVAIVCEFMN